MYFYELLSPHTPTRCLRSTDQLLLEVQEDSQRGKRFFNMFTEAVKHFAAGHLAGIFTVHF